MDKILAIRPGFSSPTASSGKGSSSRSPFTVLRTAGWFFARNYGTVPTSPKILRPLLDHRSQSYGLRPEIEGFSHGLKKCPPDTFYLRFAPAALSNPSSSRYKKDPHRMVRVFFMAEKEGFEPSKPFWGLHDFQSCALGQLRDFSIPFLSSSVTTDWFIIQHSSQIVNRYFKFFQNYFSTWKNVTSTPLDPATNSRSPFTVLRTAS